MVRAESPFKVLEMIRDNAYKLEFLGDMNVSTTFNMGDLAPYVEDNFKNSSENPSQKGEANAY